MRLALLSLLAATGCSALGATYAHPGYQHQAADAVKRVAVAGWAPAAHSGAAAVLARVATDMIKTRKSYLVQEDLKLERGWSELCAAEKREGVITVRVLEATTDGTEVGLSVTLELNRCSDGALLWRGEACAGADSNDANLAEMVKTYERDFGEDAKRYAAPAFVVLQDLVNALPDVVLSDAEVEEKIELSLRAQMPRLLARLR
jgi:probable lipoprotein (TIGR04455 family)